LWRIFPKKSGASVKHGHGEKNIADVRGPVLFFFKLLINCISNTKASGELGIVRKKTSLSTGSADRHLLAEKHLKTQLQP